MLEPLLFSGVRSSLALFATLDSNSVSCLVFFGCCIAGAFLTLLLPEVKGRDPDLILAQEMKEAAEAEAAKNKTTRA